jgi:hypothetical protein
MRSGAETTRIAPLVLVGEFANVGASNAGTTAGAAAVGVDVGTTVDDIEGPETEDAVAANAEDPVPVPETKDAGPGETDADSGATCCQPPSVR